MPEYTIRTDGKTPIFPPFNFWSHGAWSIILTRSKML
jgi:hypothetical protein